jgi:hypothetical protein
MTASRVQVAPHVNVTATTATATLGASSTVGNYLVAYVYIGDGTVNITFPSASWAWFPDSPKSPGSGRQGGFCYTKVGSAGTTYQFGTVEGVSDNWNIDLVEVTGIDSLDPLGPHGEHWPQESNVTELTAGSTGELPMADMYVIAAINLGSDSDGNLAVDSGFGIINSGDFFTIVADKLPNSEAALNPTFEWNDDTSAFGQIVTLKGITIEPDDPEEIAAAGVETSFAPLGGIVSPARLVSKPPEPDIILHGFPSDEVIRAVEAGNTAVTRRIEIFEHDMETPWNPDEDEIERLVDGNISIDYTRDERRTMDLQLDNTDNLLRPNPDDGFWYDKIIKCYRGVRFASDITRPPSVVVVEESTANQGFELRSILWRMGFTDITVDTSVTTFEQVKQYDIVASFRKTGATTKANLLKAAFAAGRKVLTFGFGSDDTHFPFIQTAAASGSQTWAVNTTSYDTPVSGGWSNESYGTATGRMITALAGPARAVATALSGATTHYTAIITENENHGRWFHWQPNQVGTQGKLLLAKGMEWLRDFRPYKMWEYQVGEFVVENIQEEYFPGITAVTGRDYTAKCMKSKLGEAASFAAGTRLDTLVRAIAANCGITKMRIPNVPEKLESRLDVEGGTERWRIMRDACEQLNYELFFDHIGTLILRPYLDPTTSPIAWTYKTGPQGNLVTYSRSINDSRIFNVIGVTGGTANEADTLPYYGQAKNTEPSSPTNIHRIGERFKPRSAPLLKSKQKCRELAQRLLKINALETYEINYSSYVYPWQEAGEIIKFLDPERDDTEPVRFLQDTLSLPMGLGPMSATGKRVTFVDDTIDPIQSDEAEFAEEEIAV